MSFDYILIEGSLDIYEDQIERYGGAHSVRDSGLLEATISPSSASMGEALG